MTFARQVATLSSILLLAACDGSGSGPESPIPSPARPAQPAAPVEPGHDHAEEPLGTVRVGELAVECAQGHGRVAAGGEGHLVVKLPYSDKGATVVRAWIGTEDRTLSVAGKGTYAPDHDDYDVHVTAPAPLPADVRWWIEIERPDRTRALGSAQPLLE